jgi:uncharacterized protein YbjT (DUF2867 family)
MPFATIHSAQPTGVRLLLLGATGAVGGKVLRMALNHPAVVHVVAPTRRPLPAHPKLTNIVTDFSQAAPTLDGMKLDAVVCALGTTIKQAGSQEAFAAVDRDLPIALARAAKSLGATSLALNSSLGASPTGNFYLRTKHQTEVGLRDLGFASYTVVRPSLIDVQRSESRPGERAALWVSHLLGPLVPRRYRPVPASAIAWTLLKSVLANMPGQAIVESENIALPLNCPQHDS